MTLEEGPHFVQHLVLALLVGEGGENVDADVDPCLLLKLEVRVVGGFLEGLVLY